MEMLVVLLLDGFWRSSGGWIVCYFDGSLFGGYSQAMSVSLARYNSISTMWVGSVAWLVE